MPQRRTFANARIFNERDRSDMGTSRADYADAVAEEKTRHKKKLTNRHR